MSQTSEAAAGTLRHLRDMFLEVDGLIEEATAANCENPTPEGTEEVRQLDEITDHLFKALEVLASLVGESLY